MSEISHRGFVAHGMRTQRDKYVRRFSPQEDELYFDLARDPGEQTNRIDEAGPRVRLLKAGVEAAMVPNPFRHHLRVVGSGDYALRLRTRRLDRGRGGRWASAPTSATRSRATGASSRSACAPRPGQPREVAFSIRPRARRSGWRARATAARCGRARC